MNTAVIARSQNIEFIIEVCKCDEAICPNRKGDATSDWTGNALAGRLDASGPIGRIGPRMNVEQGTLIYE